MFVVAVVVVFCSFALWLFRLLLYLFYYHFLCVRAQSTHHLPVPLWVAAAAGRWCCCCCFSYKNQLYFLVTVSAARCGASRLAAHPVHTPKATWLLDLIAIRAKYTHTWIYAYTLTHTSADVTRTFLFILFWVTFHISVPHSPCSHSHSHFILLLFIVGQKMLVTRSRKNNRNEPNEIETTPTTKAKLNCPKCSRLCLPFVVVFLFLLFLCKVNELFVARRRSLIVFTVVASVAKCV